MYFEDHMLCSTLRAAIYFGVMPSPDGSGSGSDGEGTPAPVHSGGCAVASGSSVAWWALAALAVARRRRGARR
jgi:hypothetical protein